MRKLLSLALLGAFLLLPACGERGGVEAGGKLIIQVPIQARVSETVVIKVTDENGRPVSGARLYNPDYLGETDTEGRLLTFFQQPGSCDLLARRGKVGEPGFAEGKGAIEIVPGVVELVMVGGINIGPPPLPGQPGQTNSYHPETTVRFKMANIGTKEITMSNSAPWEIRTGDNQTVFQPVALQVIVSLAPGETKEWSWEQKDNNGNQVKEDTYVVVLQCSEGEYRCLFSIVPATLQ